MTHLHQIIGNDECPPLTLPLIELTTMDIIDDTKCKLDVFKYEMDTKMTVLDIHLRFTKGGKYSYGHMNINFRCPGYKEKTSEVIVQSMDFNPAKFAGGTNFHIEVIRYIISKYSKYFTCDVVKTSKNDKIMALKAKLAKLEN